MTNNEKIILLERLINHFENYQPWIDNLDLCKHYCKAVKKYGKISGQQGKKYSLTQNYTISVNYFDGKSESITGTIEEIVNHINDYYKKHDTDSVRTARAIKRVIKNAQKTGTIDMSASYETAALFHNNGELEISLDEYAEYLRMKKLAVYMLKNC